NERGERRQGIPGTPYKRLRVVRDRGLTASASPATPSGRHEGRTGRGLQLNYWLQGQINQGRRTNNPRPGDLIFWDTDPHDGSVTEAT
ncbi:hypothetical protein KSK32_00830, partial [Micromonospora sp. WMMB482]|uniref:hypothetical protein n=1 Tax=Micromonospora sp. WMMB482 TaxID=2849653 RepID=UPI001C23A2BA